MAEVHIQDDGRILGERGTTLTFSYSFVGDWEYIHYLKNGLPFDDSTHQREMTGSFPGFFADSGPFNYTLLQTIGLVRTETQEILPDNTVKVTSRARDNCFGTVSIDIPSTYPWGGQIFLPYWETENDYFAGHAKAVVITIPNNFIPWHPVEPPGKASWISDSFSRTAGYEDKFWTVAAGEWQWTTLSDIRGGGRYHNNLVVFTIDTNGIGKILYN
jgi:hypothetical protein